MPGVYQPRRALEWLARPLRKDAWWPRSDSMSRLCRPVARPAFSTPRLRRLLHPAALSFVLLTERFQAEHAALPVQRTAARRAGVGPRLPRPPRPGSGRLLPGLPPWRAASSAHGTWGRRGRPRRTSMLHTAPRAVEVSLTMSAGLVAEPSFSCDGCQYSHSPRSLQIRALIRPV